MEQPKKKKKKISSHFAANFKLTAILCLKISIVR